MGFSIVEMLANYGRTTDEEIRELLTRIKIVKRKHDGLNTVYGYYELDKESLEKVCKKPRKHYLGFELTYDNLVGDEIRFTSDEIPIYNKSNSHFFFKPDIGEIFDQLTTEQKATTKAIYLANERYNEVVPGTDKCHQIFYIFLLS